MDKHNLANIRQAFGNSVYNWKIHEVAAEQIDQRLSCIKITNVVLVSLVLLLLAVQILPASIISETQKDLLDIIGTFLSVIEVSFLVFLLSYGFEEKFNQHKKTAISFRSIRDKYINLITDVMAEACSAEALRERRDALQSEFQTICALAPQTSRRNYETTQSRLKPHIRYGLGLRLLNAVKGFFTETKISNEDFTLHDEEIDLFLPASLRISPK